MSRVPELFNLMTPSAAWQKLREHLTIRRETELLPTMEALDRVLAACLLAPHHLPRFARSTMDGFAVRAVDTHGASASIPALLSIVGEVPMGQQAALKLRAGEAAVVHTGGMVPPGADAIVMVEHTQKVEASGLEVYRAVAAGENIIQVGEDVRRGDQLLPEGKLLRPQDLGGLMALGITEVAVVKRPQVAILSQGDEVVPAEVEPNPGQVRDINTHTLAALTRRAGGEPLVCFGILRDHKESLLVAARQAWSAADVVVFSAGSSVSVRDLTAEVIGEMGSPGILVHGLSIKPGKPTVVAVCGGKPVFGLPGNPVSAMIVFGLLVAPTLAWLLGRSPRVTASVTARLGRNITSQTGREDYVPVRLEEREGSTWAVPIFGKSNLIYTLVRADGLVTVPLDSNGLGQGEMVEVQMF